MDDDMPDSAESNCSVVVEPFTLNDEVSQPAANTPVSEDSPPTQPAGNSRKKKPVRLTDQILAEALSVLQSAKESSAQGLDDMDAATQAFVKFIGINLMKVPPESKFVAQMEIMQVLHKYIKVSDRNTDEQ